MIRHDGGVFAVDISTPFLDCNDAGKQFAFMRCVVALCTGKFLTVVGHWLQAITRVLLQHPAYAAFGCVGVDDKIAAKVRDQQHRCRAESMFELVKSRLLRLAPIAKQPQWRGGP